jgi:APA family basic amino acid/polyamine antiporter
MLVVSSVIGVGIFLTPGSVANLLPHPALILAVWLVGGLLSLAGALANAELAAMYPWAGGDYVYLRAAYHPIAGFLVGWLSFFVIYAGTIATLAVGFAETLAYFFPLDVAGTTTVAVVITVLTSWLNYRGVKISARVNTWTATAKIIALLALAVVGPLVAAGTITAGWSAGGAGTPVTASAFGLALSPVLFSYLGWNASVYVGSEIRDPHRAIPRSLFLGLAVCTAVYLIVNCAYLYALPVSELRGQVRVGEAVARVFFGAPGATLATCLILASVATCLNATILVGPRIAYAMALDDLFFPGVQRAHATYATPHVAIVVQAVMAIGLILLLRGFPSVLDYTTFAIVLATAADTTALYALRRRYPDAARPYRAWGYPIVPALYLIANVLIAASMLVGRPLECAVALAVAATGLPFYFSFASRSSRSNSPARAHDRKVG